MDMRKLINYEIAEKLSEKPRNQLKQIDLENATRLDYVTSRIWRARDLGDLFFRAILAKPYYSLEYSLMTTDA